MDKWSIASAALPERPTPNGLLSDWARWYFRLQVDGIGAPLTQKAKRQDLEKFLDYFIKAIGDKPVSSWRKPVTQSFINNLKSLTYRSSSISRILATLSSFARYLERQSVISPDDNPLWGVQKPLRSLMKPKHIAIYGPGGELFMEGPAAYDQFLSAANNIIQGQIENGVVRFPRRVWPYRDKALLQFLYHTGLRVAEVCNLDYGHMQPAPYAKRASLEMLSVREIRNATSSWTRSQRWDSRSFLIMKGREGKAPYSRQHESATKRSRLQATSPWESTI